jgi:hypothetical protein
VLQEASANNRSAGNKIFFILFILLIFLLPTKVEQEKWRSNLLQALQNEKSLRR